MCQYLEYLNNPMNLYFPNDQCMMLQNRAWAKDLFKIQKRPMDCNVNTKISFTWFQIPYCN